MQIAEGSVILKVQAENISALNALWCLYRDGTLKESFQALFFIDELRELTGEEQVEVIVTIDEEEYALSDYMSLVSFIPYNKPTRTQPLWIWN